MSPRKLGFTSLILIGLALTVTGAVVTARAVMLTPKAAVEIGVARINGNTFEQDLKLPAVQNLLNQSHAASNGLYLVALGTFFQMIGVVWSLFE